MTDVARHYSMFDANQELGKAPMRYPPVMLTLPTRDIGLYRADDYMALACPSSRTY